MKRISLAGIGIVAATATLTVLAITGPASLGAAKAKAKPKCPEKALCLWDDENYKGQRVVIKGQGLSNEIFDEMNDLASSAFLNSKRRVAVLWTDFDGEGVATCLTKDNRWRSNKLSAPFDESISSTEIKRKLPLACVL